MFNVIHIYTYMFVPVYIYIFVCVHTKEYMMNMNTNTNMKKNRQHFYYVIWVCYPSPTYMRPSLSWSSGKACPPGRWLICSIRPNQCDSAAEPLQDIGNVSNGRHFWVLILQLCWKNASWCLLCAPIEFKFSGCSSTIDSILSEMLSKQGQKKTWQVMR